MRTDLSAFLHFLRWVSALAVLAGHLRAFLFVPYPQLQSSSVLIKAFYLVTGFGHQAVIVFFVLSGFLVGGSVVTKVMSGTFDWREYMVNRVSRLYPVLLLALLIGWGLDYFGYHFLNLAGLYTVPGPHEVIGVMDYNASQRFGIVPFFSNLLMLQGIHGSSFGTNGPLWSLSMEFWYYLMFPAVALFVNFRTCKGLFCWNTLLLFGLVAFLPLEYHKYFVIWLLGVGASVIRFPLKHALPCVVVLIAALLNSRIGIGPSYARELFVGFACALLICTVKNGSRFPLTFARIHEQLSGFSYSVYLFHFPMLIFLLSALAQMGLWNVRSDTSTGERFLLFGVLLLICLSACYGLSRLSETKTPHIRKGLLVWLCNQRQSAAVST